MIILVGWVAYEKWDVILEKVQSVSNKASSQVNKTLKSGDDKKPTTTTVYKWKDKQGNWKFSNTKPDNIANTEIKQFRSDTNITPKVTYTEKKIEKPEQNTKSEKADDKEKKESSVPGGGIVESVKDKFNEIQELKKIIETPRNIPTE